VDRTGTPGSKSEARILGVRLSFFKRLDTVVLFFLRQVCPFLLSLIRVSSITDLFAMLLVERRRYKAKKTSVT